MQPVESPTRYSYTHIFSSVRTLEITLLRVYALHRTRLPFNSTATRSFTTCSVMSIPWTSGFSNSTWSAFYAHISLLLHCSYSVAWTYKLACAKGGGFTSRQLAQFLEGKEMGKIDGEYGDRIYPLHLFHRDIYTTQYLPPCILIHIVCHHRLIERLLVKSNNGYACYLNE